MRNLILSVSAALILCSPLTNFCYSSNLTPINIEQSTSQNGPRKGVVNRDGVAGAISKEVDKLFQQYANNKDTEGIELLLLSGKLVHLPKGTQVTLIEYGFFLHKIRTKEGKILFVAREHITLDEPNGYKK